MKVITSINSIINMYQFQKDESSADCLLNNPMLFDDEPPLKSCLNLPELPWDHYHYNKTCSVILFLPAHKIYIRSIK